MNSSDLIGPDEFQGETIWLKVTRKALSFDDVISFLGDDRAGGVVLFSGNVRNHSEGRDGVDSLEYEGYEEQLVPSFLKIANEAMSRFEGVLKVAIHHRLGLCALGESSVIIGVSSEHRESGFVASKFCIDTLKQTSPIWKKEHWSNGSDWALGANVVTQFEEL